MGDQTTPEKLKQFVTFIGVAVAIFPSNLNSAKYKQTNFNSFFVYLYLPVFASVCNKALLIIYLCLSLFINAVDWGSEPDF